MKTQRADMLKNNKVPFVWGGVCFFLLYNTFPHDVMYTWLLYSGYNGNHFQMIVQWTLQIAPPLIPLIAFYVIYKINSKNKILTILTPFLLWITGKFIIAMVIYLVSLKVGNLDIMSEKLPGIVKRIYNTEWLFKSTAYGVSIIACSYAFWRECAFERL